MLLTEMIVELFTGVGGILPRRNAEYDGCLRIIRDSA